MKARHFEGLFNTTLATVEKLKGHLDSERRNGSTLQAAIREHEEKITAQQRTIMAHKDKVIIPTPLIIREYLANSTWLGSKTEAQG